MTSSWAMLGLVVAGIVVAGIGLRKLVRFKTLHPFLPRSYNFGKRRDTLRATLALLDERGASTLVETGTARYGLERTKSDGASTVVFGTWAARNGARLHSVDLDPEAIERAREAIESLDLADAVRFHVSDSVAFLESFDEPVDFLYLDSYDYDEKDPAEQRASQIHHRREFEAIEPRLHDRSVVLIDDCGLPGGGKGTRAIERMRDRGWTVRRKAYQVLLTRE